MPLLKMQDSCSVEIAWVVLEVVVVVVHQFEMLVQLLVDQC